MQSPYDVDQKQERVGCRLMQFGSDGSGLGAGGLILVMILVALALSVIRYNFFTRPQEDRELSEEREREDLEQRAIHEDDVPR